MRIREIGAAILAASILGGCAYPVGTVEQGGASSGIYFKGAPADAEAFIDGANSGDASIYDGRKAVLAVPSGTHRVVVKAGAAILVDQVVYVGQGQRVSIKVQ